MPAESDDKGPLASTEGGGAKRAAKAQTTQSKSLSLTDNRNQDRGRKGNRAPAMGAPEKFTVEA
jgi:hypothetical protein